MLPWPLRRRLGALAQGPSALNLLCIFQYQDTEVASAAARNPPPETQFETFFAD